MADLDDALVAEYLLPPLRSDLLLGDGLAAMTDRAWTTSPVLLVAADDDPVFSPAEVAAWGDVVDVRDRVHLTGGHFALSAHVETVAGAIRRAL
jgi:surfactin synthase thioesterase subunit